MCFHMFIGLKLGVKTLPFTLHRHWKKEKVTEFMCVCLRRSSSGLIESDRFVESGKCFYPWDSRWGKWRGRWWKKEEEKKRKKLRYDGDHWNSPNNSLLKMNVYLFCQLYCKCKDIFWYSCTQISIHPSVPFSKASISIEWYITTEDSWEHFTLLKWFKSHEHKLIGAFHLLLLDSVNMPLIISE